MKVVILAGGKGTRISTVNKEIPKSMIPVNGKPVLEYQIELAKRYGYEDIIIVIGFLGNVIRSYFEDGKKWGVNIIYYEEILPLGTAGAFPELADWLKEDFFVFYGDTIMDIALDKMHKFHLEKRSEATLFLHPNDHPVDSDLVDIDDDCRIINFISKPHPEGLIFRNLVNAALYILSPKILDFISKGIKSDFGKDIFPTVLSSKLKLYGYISSEYIKDMGTPERYIKVCGDVNSGKVARLNCEYKRPAVFLDRDGVIIKEVNLLSNPEQLELIEGSAEAIRYINSKGYLAIIVTNQPVIARNLCSIDELNCIHNKLETLLGKEHAYIDVIYYCPHHPDGGYPEERKEFKINCECRKPNPGMILQATHDFNVDLSNSIMVGDRESDKQAGINAGIMKSFIIESNKPFALLEFLQTHL